MKTLCLALLALVSAFVVSAAQPRAEEGAARSLIEQEGPARCALALGEEAPLLLELGRTLTVAVSCRISCQGFINGVRWTNSCGTQNCNTCIMAQCSRTFCRAGCAS